MEVNKIEKQRNYSLDLLRIVAIIMIIIFHVCYKGLIFENLSGFNKIIVAFLLHFGEIGVNLFMLITGFFLYKSHSSKKTKIIHLIYDIWFYFILNIILCIIIKGGYVPTLSTFFPFSLGYYWYITSYITILLFSPYLNLFISSLNQKEHRKLLVVSFFLLSVIPTISGLAVNSTENGVIYSRFIWLIFLYFLGSYISKYQELDCIFKKDRESFVKLHFFSLILAVVFIFIFKYLSSPFMPKISMYYMWPPNSIVTLLMSVSLFMVFVKTNVAKKNPLINILTKASEHTLGIYLIHDAPYNYLLLASFFAWLQTYSTSKSLIIFIVLTTILVFFGGLIISIIKKHTADKVFRKFLNYISQKFKLDLK